MGLLWYGQCLRGVARVSHPTLKRLEPLTEERAMRERITQLGFDTRQDSSPLPGCHPERAPPSCHDPAGAEALPAPGEEDLRGYITKTATPMMMPSMLRALRSVLRAGARRAMRIPTPRAMRFLAAKSCPGGRVVRLAVPADRPEVTTGTRAGEIRQGAPRPMSPRAEDLPLGIAPWDAWRDSRSHGGSGGHCGASPAGCHVLPYMALFEIDSSRPPAISF